VRPNTTNASVNTSCSARSMSKPFVFPIRTDARSAATPREESGVNGGSWGSTSDCRNLAEPALIRIGLVDDFDFTRCCITNVLMRRTLGFSVSGFAAIEELIEREIHHIDLVLYYDHGARPSSLISIAGDLAMREEIADVPVIVLSDSVAALDPEAARAALGRRVRGFISTRGSDLRTVSSALRSVMAGAFFVSGDLLAKQEAARASPPLTPREMTVLSLLQEGKANKDIAHALGMSENTTKVHIKNIMRKMGAINRTQAIYKFQRLGLEKPL
jgi:DNA-binding NarL/FixJ family response regulator